MSFFSHIGTQSLKVAPAPDRSIYGIYDRTHLEYLFLVTHHIQYQIALEDIEFRVSPPAAGKSLPEMAIKWYALFSRVGDVTGTSGGN